MNEKEQKERTATQDKLVEQISSDIAGFLKGIERKYDLSSENTLGIVRQIGEKVNAAADKGGRKTEAAAASIPLSIFDNDKLSAFEAIVKHLKEHSGLKYNQIAVSLNRNPGPIGVTYRKAARKMSGPLYVAVSEEARKGPDIPLSIFKRKLSILENVVHHLRSEGMTFHDIAVALRRDDRTIWTVDHRAKKKLGMKRPAGRKR